jgi:hypothetical protein
MIPDEGQVWVLKDGLEPDKRPGYDKVIVKAILSGVGAVIFMDGLGQEHAATDTWFFTRYERTK